MLDTKKIRELRGIKTQTAISEQIGISQNHYSQIEKGTRIPSMEVLMRIARFFNVGIEELINLNPPVPPHRKPRRMRGMLWKLRRRLAF
jgi:transcriptional regulator with XRE-family HTH domain